MKQKLRQPLSILLTLLMLLALLPATALAADGDDRTENPYAHEDHTGYTEWTKYNSLPSSSGTYYLNDDVTISRAWTVPKGGVTLCLNGHNINLNEKNIALGEDVSLIICDCSDKTTLGWLDENEHLWKPGTGDGEPCNLTGGVIYGGKGAKGKGNSDGAGGGAVYVKEGSLTLAGGNLAGNQSGESYYGSTNLGGAVRLEVGSTFTMIDGSITGNCGRGGGFSASRSTVYLYGGEISYNYSSDDGGGISASGGTVTMTDGFSITGNKAEDAGGGISFGGYVNDNNPATFTMSGGTVAGNSARTGGGVYIGGSEEGVTFTMNGGTIRENSAKKSGNLPGYGGGVYLARGTFELTGGSIENNTSDNSGGGIYLYRNNYTYNPCLKLSGGTIRGNHAGSSAGGVGYYNAGTPVIELSGAPVVTGNTKGTSKLENNINLIIGVAKLTIAGVLNEGARLGVTPGSRDSGKEFTSGWSRYTHGAGYDTIFTSDDSDFVVLPSGNNELMFHKHYMTYKNDETTAGKITGTCTCGAEASAWLVGETERMYNGQPQTFEIETSDNWNDFSDVDLKVEYYDYANPEYPALLTGAPTDVGAYIAVLDGPGAGFATLSFSIVAATPELSITTTPTELTGGGRVEITVTGAPEGANVTVVCDDTSIQVTQENGVWYAELPNTDKSYTFTVNTTAVGNYASGTASSTLAVTAANTGGGDVGPVTSYIIEASAGQGGEIFPDGRVSVLSGSNKTFRITADEGYVIADVLVDSESIGAVSSYTFEKVRRGHTIEVIFEKYSGTVTPDDTGVSDWLDTKNHIQYLSGYGEGKFGPEDNMTRAQAAQMFYNLLLDKDVAITVSFSDVAENAWYAEAVNTLASLGIVDGVGGGLYAPERAITRAEFTVIAMRFAHLDTSGENIFSDVSRSDWFYDQVVGSVKYGWINGYADGTFRPNNTITRAEVTTIVNRMLGRSADREYVDANIGSLTQLNDISRAHWAYYEVMEAANAHDYAIVNGKEDWK